VAGTPVRPRRQKVEGRAVIGDGAPFDAQPRSLRVQGWSQAAAWSKLKKRVRYDKHARARKVATRNRYSMMNVGQEISRRSRAFLERPYFPSLFWRQYFSSGLISVISIPALTRNLQLRRSCGRSSSVSFPTTRQYWQS
jgi:hypothetical protein